VAPAPEGVPRASTEPHGSLGPAPADERVLDHGPCASPGCTHFGVRLYGRHCPNHVLSWVSMAFGWVEAAALARPAPLEADPLEAAIEAGVRRASRPRQWWRNADPYYALVAGLCLTYYRKKGWPITRDPAASDIAPALAEAEDQPAETGSDRQVYARFITVSRRTKQDLRFPMARADARAEFEAEYGLRPGADYAEIA
jgi:hypothetical protein